MSGETSMLATSTTELFSARPRAAITLQHNNTHLHQLLGKNRQRDPFIETGFGFTAQTDHVTVVHVNKHMAVQTRSRKKVLRTCEIHKNNTLSLKKALLLVSTLNTRRCAAK